MNDWQPGHDELTESRLDQLVDGELEGTQRNELLRDLERSPDGWRRCAMAFLESQEWRRLIRPDDPLVGESCEARAPSAGWRSGWMGRVAPWAAMAACLVIGFVVGLDAPWGSTPAHVSPATSDQLATTQDASAAGFLPVVDDFSPRTVLTPEIEQAFLRAGMQVRQKRGLMPGMRPDGNRIYVPYEELEIVPVNNTGY